MTDAALEPQERSCLVCLRPTSEPGGYHRSCALHLWGTRTPPEIELDQELLPSLAIKMVEGRTTMSGVQRKLSVDLIGDRTALRVVGARGRYIMKPQSPGHEALPENEHLTMLLASFFGIDVPPFGLIRMKDGSLAYIVARFDRPLSGGKRRQEDFCQLGELRPFQKYDRSAELCFRLLRKFSVQAPIDAVKLYRLFVFSWFVGNGDLHLKNVSLLENEDRLMRLSPAYDLMSTFIVLGVPNMALKIGGRDNNLSQRTWRDFAAYCEIRTRAANRVLEDVRRSLPGALDTVRRSFLPPKLQESYLAVLQARARTFLRETAEAIDDGVDVAPPAVRPDQELAS